MRAMPAVGCRVESKRDPVDLQGPSWASRACWAHGTLRGALHYGRFRTARCQLDSRGELVLDHRAVRGRPCARSGWRTLHRDGAVWKHGDVAQHRRGRKRGGGSNRADWQRNHARAWSTVDRDTLDTRDNHIRCPARGGMAQPNCDAPGSARRRRWWRWRWRFRWSDGNRWWRR